MKKVLEHTFGDRHERMEVLRGGDRETYMRLLEAFILDSEAIALAAMCRAARHGCVLLRFEGTPHWFYLHRSAKYEGCLQLTTWDDEGPVGDVRVTKPSDFSFVMDGTLTVSTE